MLPLLGRCTLPHCRQQMRVGTPRQQPSQVLLIPTSLRECDWQFLYLFRQRFYFRFMAKRSSDGDHRTGARFDRSLTSDTIMTSHFRSNYRPLPPTLLKTKLSCNGRRNLEPTMLGFSTAAPSETANLSALIRFWFAALGQQWCQKPILFTNNVKDGIS